MAGHDITETDYTETDYTEAVAAGRDAAKSEFRAESVSYIPRLDAIEVITQRNGGFVIPRGLVKSLQAVDAEHLAGMTLWPDGSLIEIEALDVHVSVDGMIKAALPVLVPRQIAARMFAAAGGAVKSVAKTQSSRQNGKKGGRPRKHAA
jgi:hypothetical protein